MMSVHRGGQVNRGNFLSWIDPNDTEGEGVGGALLHPAGPDDHAAQGFHGGRPQARRERQLDPPSRRPEVGIESKRSVPVERWMIWGPPDGVGHLKAVKTRRGCRSRPLCESKAFRNAQGHVVSVLVAGSVTAALPSAGGPRTSNVQTGCEHLGHADLQFRWSTRCLVRDSGTRPRMRFAFACARVLRQHGYRGASSHRERVSGGRRYDPQPTVGPKPLREGGHVVR